VLQSSDALSRHAASSIEEFEIRGLVAKEVSTLNSEDSHNFLSKLGRFSVSLRNWDNDAGWAMNAQDGFAAFAEKLGDYFFDHLHSTEYFGLKADKTVPLGLDPGISRVHLALRPPQTPLLRSLELRYIYVCPELTDFLVSHLEMLEELVVTDCLYSLELLDDDTEGMHWYGLFDAL
jgi:hypothetical protein